jgi:hypothetical protein
VGTARLSCFRFAQSLPLPPSHNPPPLSFSHKTQPFLASHPALAALFPPPAAAIATARTAGGLIAGGTLAYCACVMLGAAIVRDDPGYVPPALQPGRGTVAGAAAAGAKKRE